MKSDQAFNSYPTDAPEDFAPYKAVCKPAVISLMLAGVGLLSLMFPAMLVLPILGGVFAMWAMHSLSKYPEELTGRGLAIAGGLICVTLTISSISYHTYVYMTEVPEGYERITFRQLQPETTSQVLPENINELNNKDVFLKGYMHPTGTQGKGDVQEFVLVPDMGTCCFGGQPDLTDMVQVRLLGNLKTRYNRTKKKLAGRFKVDPRKKPVAELDGVYYTMDADYVRN